MDEDKSDNVAKTKLEIEIEKHVLSTTVKLSDGTSGTVFTRGLKNESQMFLYNCHLCGVSNLPGERCLQTHIAGRKHQTKLSFPIFDATLFRAPLMQRNKVQMQIAPGEPVPPGFENEVKPVAELQSILDKYKDQPLVGLEYVLELSSRDEKEPYYNCLLCNKRGDPRTILNHITSYNHRIKYLEKHYPAASRELEQYRYNVDARTVVYRIIQSICEAIEDFHGRLTPDVYDANEYKKNPMKFLQQVANDRHFDEKNGPNFVSIIDHQLISDAVKLEGMSKSMAKRNPSPPGEKSGGSHKRRATDRQDRKSLESISSISSSSLSRSRSRSPILNRILLLRNRIKNAAPLHIPRQIQPQRPVMRSRSPERFYRRSHSRSRSRSLSPSYRHSKKRLSPSPPPRKTEPRPKLAGSRDAISITIAKHRGKSPNLIEKRQMLPTPKELSQQASEIANERYKWEKFRCMVELAVTELEKSQKEYEKNPEKHPLYSEEWKKFWNRRYKELQAEKKDPAKHDFKPEWIEFWTKRMKELFDENIENKKQEIRKKLGLPDESEEKTDQLKEQYTIPDIHKKREAEKEKTKLPSPIQSDDDDVIIEEDVRIPRPLSRNRSSRNSTDRGNRRSRSRPPSYEMHHHSSRRSRERISRDRISRDRFSPIPKPRSRSREYYREREYHEHVASMHRRSPPPPQIMRYSESYDEWAKRYYGPTRMRPVYVRTVDKYKEDKDDEPLTVVSVLRLLTALEEHLGSLGPKIIDLLAKALALEKVKANSADDLLMNEDNCVIFETVKEKLKGQLIAEVIENQKINAVKRAIKNIAAVIHMVNEKAKEKEKKELELELEKRQSGFEEKIIIPTQSLAAASNDPDAIEKGEIAKKIAASLIAQGKTDITGDQLEVLINTFIEMSKQSKGNKQISTAAFIKDHEIADTSSHSNTTSKSNNSVADELERSLESNKRQDEKDDTSNMIESLTDSDLQTLLQNFKNLSSEEQQELILYLKKLESTDPGRVEKLRKYVNTGSGGVGGAMEKEKKNISKSPSPNNQSASKPFDIFDISDDVDKIIEMNQSPVKKVSTHDVNEFDIEPADRVDDILNTKIKMSQYIEDSEDRRKFLDSEDDDDYSFDDVLKAASQKVRTGNNNPSMDHEMMGEMSQHSGMGNDNTSTKSNAGLNLSLADTKNLIATLMGSLQKNVTSRTSAQKASNMQQNNFPPVLPQPINQLNPLTSNLNLPFYMQQNQQGSQQQHQSAPLQSQSLQPNQNMYNAGQQQSQYQPPQPPMMPMPLMDMNPMAYNYNQMGGRMQNPFEFQQNQMFPSQMMHQQQQEQQQQNQRQHHQYTNYHQQQSNLKFLSGRKK